MTELRCTLLTDGGFDRVLEHHLRWLLLRHLATNCALNFDWADLSSRRQRPRILRDRITEAIRLYPCDILFVHRDAERESLDNRESEIAESVPVHQATSLRYVSVIPVRMTEAWLLFDETAIRLAANNPNGQGKIALPKPSKTEDLPDPKSLLKTLLQDASELPKQRLRRFDVDQAMRNVVLHITDFSPLLELNAFARLDEIIWKTLQRGGWANSSTNKNT